MHTTTTLLLAIVLGIPSGLVAQRGKDRKDTTDVEASGHLEGKLQATKLAKPMKIKLGKRLSGHLELRLTDFFGRPGIAAQFDLANKTRQKLEVKCYIAIFDKAGKLITCSNPSATYDPGERMPIGSAVAVMTKADVQRVASYQLRWFETAKD